MTMITAKLSHKDTEVQQAGWKERESLHCPFLKVRNKCPNRRKKKNTLMVFNYGFHWSFKMQFQEHLGEKFEIFPCRAFFSCVIDEVIIEVPLSQEIYPVMKNPWLGPWPTTLELTSLLFTI